MRNLECKDFRVVKALEWQNEASGRECLRNGGQLREGWIWRRLRVGLRVMDVLGEPLGSLNTCHHPGAGKILTTTQPLA